MNFNSFNKRRGITLIELLVAMGILSLLLAAVFVVYRTQLRTATTQRSISLLQTDIQQAFNIMKFDVLMAGYGIPATQIPINGVNRSDAPDVLSLMSTGFIVGGTTRWSYTMDIFGANQIIVRRWGDERVDVQVGDRILIMDDRKKLIITQPLTVTAREALTYNNQPAYRLTLSGNVQTAAGNFVYVIPGGQFQTVQYSLRNDTLLRAGAPFLTGVEDFQVSYWVDQNKNGIEDAGERVHNPQGIADFNQLLRSVRLNLVLLGALDMDYTYPQNQITLEDHTYNLNGDQLHRRRRIYTLDIKVRNVR
uniref:Prepilin-type N-terminal cleavage/methylation domain-containing protein n=1 Tax=candidate division WOR-3 bacterium TaxID=2052148 RepID=A0A7V3ZWW0_UNCW3